MIKKDLIEYIENIKITDETINILKQYNETNNISLVINYLISNDRFDIVLLNILTKNLDDSKMIKNFIDSKNLEKIILNLLEDNISTFTKENIKNFYKILILSEKVSLNDKLFLLSTLETFIFNQRAKRDFIYLKKDISLKLRNFGIFLYKNLINYFIDNNKEVLLSDLSLINFIFTKTNVDKNLDEITDDDRKIHFLTQDLLDNNLRNKNFVLDILNLKQIIKNKLQENLNTKENNTYVKYNELINGILSSQFFIFMIKNMEELDFYMSFNKVDKNIIKLIESKKLILQNKYLLNTFNLTPEQLISNLEPVDNLNFYCGALNKDSDNKPTKVLNQLLKTQYHYVEIKNNILSKELSEFLKYGVFYQTSYGKQYLKFFEKEINVLIDYINEEKLITKDINLPKDLQKITSFRYEYYYPLALTEKLTDGSSIYDKLSKETKLKIIKLFLEIKTKRIKVDLRCSSLEEINKGNDVMYSNFGLSKINNCLETILFNDLNDKEIETLKNIFTKKEINCLVVRKINLEFDFKDLLSIKNYLNTYDKFLNNESKVLLISKYILSSSSLDFTFEDIYNKEMINDLLKEKPILFLEIIKFSNYKMDKFFLLIDNEILEKILIKYYKEICEFKTKDVYENITCFLICYSNNQNLINKYLEGLDNLSLKNKVLPYFKYNKNNVNAKVKREALEKMKTFDLFKNGTKQQLEYIKLIEEVITTYKNVNLITYVKQDENKKTKEIKEELSKIILNYLK